MCTKIKAVGKTVDEAIFKGLNELEISIDEVDVEIIQSETKGVFGIGTKPAIVMLTKRTQPAPKAETVREPAPRRDEIKEAQSTRFHEETHPEPAPVSYDSAPKARPEPGFTPAERNQPRRQNQNQNRDQNQDQDQPYNRNTGFRQTPPPKPRLNFSMEAVEQTPAAVFVRDLMGHMGFNVDVSAASSFNEQRVNISSGDNAAVLIGKHGETLDAIQYLTALIINRNSNEEEHIKVSVDIDGYRQRRYEKLVRTARTKASMVKSSGRNYSFEPMTAFDRRIIHSTLQRHPFVTTHSEGEEPNRYVVISPKQRRRRY